MDEGELKETMRREEKKENQFIDADRFLDAYEERIEPCKPSPEVLEEFVEAALSRLWRTLRGLSGGALQRQREMKI
jgi:hypothetical protein